MKENGFEYIDLGLPSGTMWATCNVGAAKPEDWGLLFQFGRVDGYLYNDKHNQFKTDDTPLTTSGKVYKANDILDLVDDAAHVNMGGKWRMPTKEDFDELFNTVLEEDMKPAVQDLLEKKVKMSEADKAPKVEVINKYIEEKLVYYKEMADSMADDRNPDWNPLEGVFSRMVVDTLRGGENEQSKAKNPND